CPSSGKNNIGDQKTPKPKEKQKTKERKNTKTKKTTLHTKPKTAPESIHTTNHRHFISRNLTLKDSTAESFKENRSFLSTKL
ncbi:mCG1031894, partial [Mus musculus]